MEKLTPTKSLLDQLSRLGLVSMTETPTVHYSVNATNPSHLTLMRQTDNRIWAGYVTSSHWNHNYFDEYWEIALWLELVAGSPES